MERTRAKLGINDITMHNLRRTAGTYMSRFGVPKDVRERILNHGGMRKGSITEGVYNLFKYDAEKRAALELWADALAGSSEAAQPKSAAIMRGSRASKGRTRSRSAELDHGRSAYSVGAPLGISITAAFSPHNVARKQCAVMSASQRIRTSGARLRQSGRGRPLLYEAV
jgi:hypothetical protein